MVTAMQAMAPGISGDQQCILSEEYSTVELSSTSSLLEASWCCFVNCFIVIITSCSSIHCLNCFVSAACCLHCCFGLNLIRLTVTNPFILLSLLMELLLLLPFLVVANSAICVHPIVFVGLLLVLGFVQLSLHPLVNWVLC